MAGQRGDERLQLILNERWEPSRRRNRGGQEALITSPHAGAEFEH